MLRHGIDNAKKEIQWFLEYTTSLSKEKILFNKAILSEGVKADLLKFIKRRCNQEPFQYIIESATFFGRDFYVNPSVLIPRPETELIINILKSDHKVYHNAMDIGTGSGNLALTLSLEKIAKNIIAIDKSKSALKVAERNAKKHQTTNVRFININFLQDSIEQQFDLIISNPPYVSINEYRKLEKQIKYYEPMEALTDFDDGLLFYKKISQSLNLTLRDNGVVLLEIGLEKHKAEINQIFKNYLIKWYKDLNGNYRVIKIKKG
tara:strand:+ start:1454 stop:2242 length:789 start_codon:yes stop_codon:yes gene_type:complete